MSAEPLRFLDINSTVAIFGPCEDQRHGPVTNVLFAMSQDMDDRAVALVQARLVIPTEALVEIAQKMLTPQRKHALGLAAVH